LKTGVASITFGAVRRPEVAALSVVIAFVLTAIGTFRGDDDHATRQYLIVGLVILVAAALIFGVVVPRIDSLGRGALIMGIIAVLSIVVFWLGLPPIFAGAAAILGLDALAEEKEPQLAKVGLALAGLTVVAATIIAFVG
jgi:hypothetical protein